MAVNNTIKSGIGTRISISTAAFTGTKDATGFGAATYAKLQVSLAPRPGGEFQQVTWDDLETGLRSYYKGAKTQPAWDLTAADIPTDPGLTAVKAAFDDKVGEWAIKIEHTTDGSLTPRIIYFAVRVMSYRYDNATLSDINTITASLQQVSDPVVVAPT